MFEIFSPAARRLAAAFVTVVSVGAFCAPPARAAEDRSAPTAAPTAVTDESTERSSGHDAAIDAVSDPGAAAAGMASDDGGESVDTTGEQDGLAPEAVVVVRNNRLEGRIRRIDAEGLEFEPAFGKGRIDFAYADVDHIETRDAFHFFDEDGTAYTGRILGIDQSGLRVGSSDEDAVWIPVGMIAVGLSKKSYDESFMTRTRAKWNHWSAVVDLGIELDSGAIEKRKVNTTATVDWNKRPWGATWFAEYAFESQEKTTAPPPDDERRTTKDELRSYLNVQRDIGQGRWLGYLFTGGEFDIPRNVKQRFYPSLGLGYRVVDSKRGNLELRGGFGGVFEEFSNSPMPGETASNQYFAGQIALTAAMGLWRDSELRGSAMYMPELVKLADDWLFRFDLTYTIPLFDPLALRLRLSEVNDNNPSNAGNNKTVFVTAFALRF